MSWLRITKEVVPPAVLAGQIPGQAEASVELPASAKWDPNHNQPIFLSTDDVQYRVAGPGLCEATVREHARLVIETTSKLTGQRVPSNGFVVRIDGVARANSKVSLLEDLTHEVTWHPIQAGVYRISVFRFGCPLPGSPWLVEAVPPLPCAQKCWVRGAKLTRIVAREISEFEIGFKDKLGTNVHAVEVDCFVEPLTIASPRRAAPPLAPPTAVEAAKPLAKPSTSTIQAKPRPGAKGGGKEVAGRGKRVSRGEERETVAPAEEDSKPLPKGARVGAQDGAAQDGAVAAGKPLPKGMTGLVTGFVGGLVGGERGGNGAAGAGVGVGVGIGMTRKGSETRHRNIRIKVMGQALAVRDGPNPTLANRLGELMPGTVVTVVEERAGEDGAIYGLLALDYLQKEATPSLASGAHHGAIAQVEQCGYAEQTERGSERSLTFRSSAISVRTGTMVSRPQQTARSRVEQLSTRLRQSRSSDGLTSRSDVGTERRHERGSGGGGSTTRRDVQDGVQDGGAGAGVGLGGSTARSGSGTFRGGGGMTPYSLMASLSPPHMPMDTYRAGGGTYRSGGASSRKLSEPTPAPSSSWVGGSGASGSGQGTGRQHKIKHTQELGLPLPENLQPTLQPTATSPRYKEPREESRANSFMRTIRGRLAWQEINQEGRQDKSKMGAALTDSCDAAAEADSSASAPVPVRPWEPTPEGAGVGSALQLPETAWTTLVEPGGAKNVSSRLRLDVGTRREHLHNWSLRRAHDAKEKRMDDEARERTASDDLRRASSAAAKAPESKGNRMSLALKIANKAESDAKQNAKSRGILLELQAELDPFSFAFGGVYPGTLHAHGKVREVHKLSYSVGIAGEYLLHVRLRHQAAALPGSPFHLTVQPGPPFAASTALPAATLVGHVGERCEVVIRPADTMGNACQTGGGGVKCSCNDAKVAATCDDLGDGSYRIGWTSQRPGEYEGAVTIRGEHVLNSPMRVVFHATTPVIEHSELSGLGGTDKNTMGKQAVVGEKALIRVRLRDRFLNNITPSKAFQQSFAVGIALPERGKGGQAKGADVESAPFEGKWCAEEPNVYEIVFVPTVTTIAEVRVWCTLSGRSERYTMPGSPFAMSVSLDSKNMVTEKIDESGIRPGDYRVDLSVLEDAQRKWGTCTIDAFASNATKLLSKFWTDTDIPVGSSKDGSFLGVDALAHPWPEGERIWAHPPVELLLELTQKLKSADRLAETIVCAPQHKSKNWYIELTRLSDEQLKFRKGCLEGIAKDAPSRIAEWPITLFHIPSKPPSANAWKLSTTAADMRLAMPPTRQSLVQQLPSGMVWEALETKGRPTADEESEIEEPSRSQPSPRKGRVARQVALFEDDLAA